MSEPSTFLGFTRHQQAAGIGAVGAVLVVYGLTTTSAVDAGYNLLPFGVGLVMVLYAVGVVLHDALFFDGSGG